MPIKKFSLKNGMQALFEENHTAKVVSFNALVNVGSRNESDEEAGICHVIEHMLFKGTPTRPAGRIAAEVEAAGGEINAYTSIDQTVFYINMATEFSERGLEILADAIQNPLFDTGELEREKEVILEEIRREQDNPPRMAGELLFRQAFTKHTYGRPIIGTPETVKSFSREKILGFYKSWYSPKNMVFIVVGDFKTDDMRGKIEMEFLSFSGQPPPLLDMPAEPEQTKPRLMIKGMNIQSAHLAMGFHIPNITHADVPSLDVLSHIFGGAESSHLVQEVKEKKGLVHNIYSYSFTPKEPGLFIVGATMKDENAPRAIAAIMEEMGKLKDSSAAPEEIAAAKLNIRSNEIYEKETVGGFASKIAYFMATAGGHEFEDIYYRNLTAVSAGDVKKIAEKYLSPSGCSVSLLVPENSKWIRSPLEIEKALDAAKKQTGRTKKEKEPVRKIRLKNGVRLIVLENPNLPIVSICASALGGTRFETRNTNGISGLWARTLTKGTANRSAVTVARDIEKLAGHIDGFAGRNTVGLQCEFLSEHFRDGLSLFSDVLTCPSFTAEEVGKERTIVLRAIKDQEDDLSSLAFAEFLKRLFPSHPYGLRILGTTKSVRKIKPKQIMNYHKNVIRAGNLVMSVVGDVRTDEVVKTMSEMFGKIPKGAGAGPKIFPDPPPENIRRGIITKKGKQQAHIVLGFRGATMKALDRYAMTVLNNILSGQGGRLFKRLRDEMSLAYAVSSLHQEGIEPGFLAVYIGTEPGKIDTAVDGIIYELEKIHREAVTAEELDRSKQYLVGTYELGLQRNSSLASTYALNECYGIELGEVNNYPRKILAVSRDEILKTARRYIRPNAYTLAIVKPQGVKS